VKKVLKISAYIKRYKSLNLAKIEIGKGTKTTFGRFFAKNMYRIFIHGYTVINWPNSELNGAFVCMISFFGQSATIKLKHVPIHCCKVVGYC